MVLIGISLLAIGWMLHHWVARRRFYRRDALGNDMHGAYGSMLIARFLESVAGFIGGTARLFGFLILLFAGLTYFGLIH
jgi:hypothetical protein